MSFKLLHNVFLISILSVVGSKPTLAENNATQQGDTESLETRMQPLPTDVPVESIESSNATHILQAQQKALSLAAIPATTHRGKSLIVAAHGEAGVTIRNTSGELLWTIDTPARLVSHYQGFLVVFHQTEDGTTTLSRYKIGTGAPALVESVTPSPIAATTLQRTAFAAIGPARLSGSTLKLEDKVIVAPMPISAIAAAPYFPPLVGGLTLLIALENGDIVIRAK